MPRTNSTVNRPPLLRPQLFAPLAVVAVVAVAGSALAWRSAAVEKELSRQHTRLVAEVVKGAGNSILSQLRELRRGVTLLVEDNESLIREIIAAPDDDRLQEHLRERIERTFPESFAYTLADGKGSALLEDFDGLVGTVCQREIRHFAETRDTSKLVIHPNPLGYHFDIMRPIQIEDGGGADVNAIFFLSFKAEVLSESLSKHALPGYDLLVLNRAQPGLIEAGADGPRNQLRRPIHLAREELERIEYRNPLPGTQWDVVAVRLPSTGVSSTRHIWRHTRWMLFLLGFLGIAAALVVRRSLVAADSAASTLNEQRKLLRATVDTVAEAIVTINERGIIQTFNPAAERIFGYRAEEIAGKNVKVLMPAPYHNEHDGYLSHYLKTGEAKVIGIGREVTGQRKDGSTFPMELSVNDTEVSGRRLFTGAIRDISERKEVDRMKNEFISIVSHELRTPLTSIRGSLGLIAGGAGGSLPPQAKQLIDIAANNSERLVRLINDILDIEKIEAGKMQFDIKQQPLLPLVVQAIDSNRGFAEQYNVEIELDGEAADVSVNIDADRITQVLVNLLSNAIKFSPQGRRVRVTLGLVAGGARVSVIDSGPGIAEEFQGRIFSKFAQADSSDTRQKGGSGLGLSICKAIVEEHGGNIGFESEPGHGSRFFFELPVVATVGKREIKLDGSLPARRGARLLVCEDDRDIATLVRLMLEGGGYRVDVVHNVEQAREKIRAIRYDALTLDLSMPGEDGLSFIHELASQEATRDLPIVVLSAKAEQGRQDLAGAAIGVIDWLSKPIDQQRLIAAVKNATGTTGAKILHVEDDPDLVKVVGTIVSEAGQVEYARSLQEARHWLNREQFDLVMLDLSLPDGSGLELLPLINDTANPPAVLVFSAHELSPESAREVDAALVKSQTDNFRLLETVNALLGRDPE